MQNTLQNSEVNNEVNKTRSMPQVYLIYSMFQY